MNSLINKCIPIVSLNFAFFEVLTLGNDSFAQFHIEAISHSDSKLCVSGKLQELYGAPKDSGMTLFV